ncbi:MAG TPA: T9SS type A sorting domain-containing protein, partial [Ohtaekwangia sp.]|nr:T9SS type A sorting domain-containing protein [Ohtaekwangia sp.]
RTGIDVGTFVKIPVDLHEGSFQISLEVTRATHEFTVYIEGEQVFTGLGFAGNIEETAFLGVNNGIIDIDNFRIIDGGQEAIPYVTLDPSTVTVPAGDSVSVTVNFSTSELVYADYASSIKIKPEEGEAITIPVLLAVTGEPMIAIDNTPMYLPTGKDSTALVKLRNTGGEPVNYTTNIAFEGADTGWLSATIPAGTVMKNHAVYLPLKYDATALDPGEYHATLTIASNAPTLTVPIVFHVTAPGHIVVDPVSFTIPPGDYDQWFTVNVRNTGESRLIFAMSSETRLRTPYPYELTPLNAAPVQPGPDGIEAVPNRGQSSPWGNAYDYYFEYFMPNGNVDGADYWGADRENWEGIRPAEYIYYIRGLSDGTGQPSTLFSPIVPAASDNLSTASMHMNLMYSAGTTWQIVAQTTTQVVTRVQINRDQTMQILVRDDDGNASFQRLNIPFPKEYFDFKIESDRLTSNFSIFFNGTRIFTGRGFADHIEQLGFLSLMEEAGSAVFFDAFSLYDCPAVVQITDQFWDEDFLTDTVTRALAPGEGRDMQLVFSDWNLAPGTYQDSLQIASDDPAQPIVYVPYTVTVTKPIVPQPDYQVVRHLEVQSDTLMATVMAGEPVTVELSIHNPSAVAQSLYYVKPTVNYNSYKAYSHGSRNFEWIDISATGTKLDLGDDDSKAIQLPFAVFVDPNLYSEFITISSNGYLRVGNINADNPINRPINSYYEVVENVIAPYWDDLKPDELSGIYYQADHEQLIVQYTNIPVYGSTFRNTFQVILRRNSSMKFQYLKMYDQQSASVGMAASAYTYALGLAANEAYVKDSLAVVIIPFFEGIDDAEHGTLYEAYPWIRYPAGESITIAPHSTALLPVRLDASVPGVAKGNIILTSKPTDYYDDPYYQADHKDAFVIPVALTVTDNPPPVISPVEPITIVQGTLHQITFTATDENDSLISFSLDYAPSFATLLQTTSTSATYTFAPGADDIGEYDVLVVAKDARGRTNQIVLHVTVIYAGNTVANFSLVNTVTGEVISDFESIISLDRLRPDFADLNIRANTLPATVGSVKFKVNGSQRNIDGSSPYLLKKGVLATLSGENILLAEPFTKAHGHGQRGTAKTATIIIQSQPAIVSFSLVNVFSNQTLETFTTHLLLDRSHPDFGSFVIRANTSSPVGSVKFRINGSQRNIDNSIPYQLNAQALPALPFGDTRLFAQPFSEASGHGERGQSLEAVITLVDGVSAQARSATDGVPAGNTSENFAIEVYPVPVQDVLNFNIRGEGPAAYRLAIINTMGQVVLMRQITMPHFEVSTAALGLSSGVYYIHVQHQNGARFVKKIVKQ